MDGARRRERRRGDDGARGTRVAVVDMGSNSWRLVVYGYEPGTPWWSLVDEIREAVRISAGLGEGNNVLRPERVELALHTAAVFSLLPRAHRPDRGGRDERHPRRRQRPRAARPDPRSDRASPPA